MIIALADQCINSATNFLTCVIIGRSCIDEFGLYILGLTLIFLVIGIQNSLISLPYTVYYAKLPAQEQAVFNGSSLIHQIGFSLFVTAAFCFLATAIFPSGVGPAGLEKIFLSITAIITLILFKEYARQVCMAQMRMVNALIQDSAMAAIQLGGLFFLAHQGKLTASLSYWVIGFACGIAGLAWLVSARRNFKIQRKEVILHLKQNWSVAKSLVPGSLAFNANIQLYPWFLSLTHGTAVTGIFAACSSAAYLSTPFLIGMGNYVAPSEAHALAKRGIVGLNRVINTTFILIVIVMTLFSVFMFKFGEPVVAAMYKLNQPRNGVVVDLLVLSQLAWGLTIPFSHGLLMIGRADAVSRSSFISLAITVSLGFLLSKFYGPLGAACTLLIGNIMASTYRYLTYWRQTGDYQILD
jgi:O-antigen/teichoic acid export membrane protein